jgi:hypothetical protein
MVTIAAVAGLLTVVRLVGTPWLVLPIPVIFLPILIASSGHRSQIAGHRVGLLPLSSADPLFLLRKLAYRMVCPGSPTTRVSR